MRAPLRLPGGALVFSTVWLTDLSHSRLTPYDVTFRHFVGLDGWRITGVKDDASRPTVWAANPPTSEILTYCPVASHYNLLPSFDLASRFPVLVLQPDLPKQLRFPSSARPDPPWPSRMPKGCGVWRYVGRYKREMGLATRDTFVPQSYGWGQEAQVGSDNAVLGQGGKRVVLLLFGLRIPQRGDGALHRLWLPIGI